MTIEDYVQRMEHRWQQKLVRSILDIIRSVDPKLEEGIKYGIPYFSYGGGLCYINPTKDRVNLGIAYGSALKDPFGVLTGDGVTVRHIAAFPNDKWPEDAVIHILHMAMEYNEIRFAKKLKKTQNQKI